MKNNIPTKLEIKQGQFDVEEKDYDFELADFCLKVWDRVEELFPRQRSDEDYNRIAIELFEADNNNIKEKRILAQLCYLRAVFMINPEKACLSYPSECKCEEYEK